MSESDEEGNWTTEIDSKYRLVLLAAKRSKQLQRGAKPRIFSPAKKTTRVAIEEVRRGLVQYQRIVKPAKAE
ncbi:MAG TPA: DNA-directed RNA polymerase subunit omega [Blastocatellia bacterium]|nr:DNA-directed RNA polymerase subunit omega [Blastocatellia bacterium]